MAATGVGTVAEIAGTDIATGAPGDECGRASGGRSACEVTAPDGGALEGVGEGGARDGAATGIMPDDARRGCCVKGVTRFDVARGGTGP